MAADISKTALAAVTEAKKLADEIDSVVKKFAAAADQLMKNPEKNVMNRALLAAKVQNAAQQWNVKRIQLLMYASSAEGGKSQLTEWREAVLGKEVHRFAALVNDVVPKYRALLKEKDPNKKKLASQQLQQLEQRFAPNGAAWKA